MSSDIVIRVENLSKKYAIGKARRNRSGDGLRHAIQDAVSAPFRSLRRIGQKNASTSEPSSTFTSDSFPSTSSKTSEDFWALKDVSFEVEHGEILGIVGRNGAGKSTLLKILSRITEPTRGRIGIKGRVASLLEVGTGFHPELTGRENVYLNGAILGMTRAEVRSKFDEIIDFAGVEKFLDTAVKYYSSGMYVRLAFAVAAHLEPEILIVDEVLAVGDSEFQKKCLGKMKQVAQGGGRTVLFVSHNMGAVDALCNSALCLDKGEIKKVGATAEVLQWLRQERMANDLSNSVRAPRIQSSGGYHIRELRPAAATFDPREEMRFTVSVGCPANGVRCHFAMHLLDEFDTNVTTISTEYLQDRWITGGEHTFNVSIRSPWLPPGSYRVNAFLYGTGILDKWEDACSFEIGPGVMNKGFSSASSRNTGKTLCDFQLSQETPQR